MDIQFATETDHAAEQANPAVPSIDITCLTIADCTPIADQIRQHLLASPKVELKLAHCEEIDTAGVQLLTILRCDEGVASRLIFDTPSETAQAAFSLLGLGALLSNPTNAA